MTSLRKDPNQWLVYDEAGVTAAVRGLEVIALMLVGPALARHGDIEVRAMGNVAEKVADARLRYMLGLMQNSEASDEERVVAAHVVRIVDYLSSGGESGKPVEGLDDVWASLVWLDSQVQGAGVDGPGWAREVVRGVR